MMLSNSYVCGSLTFCALGLLLNACGGASSASNTDLTRPTAAAGVMTTAGAEEFMVASNNYLVRLGEMGTGMIDWHGAQLPSQYMESGGGFSDIGTCTHTASAGATTDTDNDFIPESLSAQYNYSSNELGLGINF